MKKIFCIVAILTILLCMSIPAFASSSVITSQVYGDGVGKTLVYTGYLGGAPASAYNGFKTFPIFDDFRDGLFGIQAFITKHLQYPTAAPGMSNFKNFYYLLFYNARTSSINLMLLPHEPAVRDGVATGTGKFEYKLLSRTYGGKSYYVPVIDSSRTNYQSIMGGGNTSVKAFTLNLAQSNVKSDYSTMTFNTEVIHNDETVSAWSSLEGAWLGMTFCSENLWYIDPAINSAGLSCADLYDSSIKQVEFIIFNNSRLGGAYSDTSVHRDNYLHADVVIQCRSARDLWQIMNSYSSAMPYLTIDDLSTVQHTSYSFTGAGRGNYETLFVSFDFGQNIGLFNSNSSYAFSFNWFGEALSISNIGEIQGVHHSQTGSFDMTYAGSYFPDQPEDIGLDEAFENMRQWFTNIGSFFKNMFSILPPELYALIIVVITLLIVLGVWRIVVG